MRSIRVGTLLATSLLALAVAGPAAAERPTCGDLLSARQLGRSAAEVASDFRTTSIRVEACERLAQQHQRLAQQRARVAAARAQRIAR